MSYNLPCDKCSGSGIVEVPLFYSIAKDPCNVCKGTGKKTILCPNCKQHAATITINFNGEHKVNECSFCFLRNLANDDDSNKNPHDPFYGCFT